LQGDEKKKVYSRFVISGIIIAVIAAITIPTGILTINGFTYLVSILGIIIPTLYFIFMYRSPKTNEDEKSRLIAYIPLFIAAIMFWAIAEQGSIILAEYADKRTQLSAFGINLQSSWFQSLNPLFIITLSPLFAGLWLKMGER